MTDVATPPEHPCVDCGEPTLNEQRCRDCDIDYLVELATCPHCGTSQLDLKVLGFLRPTVEIHGYGGACPWVAL